VTSRGVWLAFAVLIAALFVSTSPAYAQGPISASITGPPAAAASTVTFYNLTITGGPSSSVNYTVQWYITGPNLAGGLPLQAKPSSVSGKFPTFKLNITTPANEQTITMVVSVSAASGGTTENTTAEQSVVIVTPIVLSATFRNNGSTAAVNVTVRFFVDDVAVGTKTVSRIDPNKDATVTFNYLPVALQPGTHRVRVEADLDGNGIIDPARGEVATSQLFYKGTPGLSTGWTVLIGIGVFVPVLFVTIAVRRRRRA
jgi:hypothetical protein